MNNRIIGIQIENHVQIINNDLMKTNLLNQKEEEVSSSQDFEKSELMELFESELRNPFRGQMDLINAILEQE